MQVLSDTEIIPNINTLLWIVITLFSTRVTFTFAVGIIFHTSLDKISVLSIISPFAKLPPMTIKTWTIDVMWLKIIWIKICQTLCPSWMKLVHPCKYLAWLSEARSFCHPSLLYTDVVFLISSCPQTPGAPPVIMTSSLIGSAIAQAHLENKLS